MNRLGPGVRALVVGCGYAGERLVHALSDAGVAVQATTRLARRVGKITTLALDLDLGEKVALPEHDVLFYLAPPQPEGVRDLRSETLIALLNGSNTPCQSIVLVSTTGVYGNCDGAEVNEHSPLRPGTDRAVRRVASEAVWRAACSAWSVPLAVLRVAGIYGPSRLSVSRLESGEPLLAADLATVSNRIHVEDLVTALQYSVGLNETVDVADGTPLPLTTFYHYLADTVGKPRLPETTDVSKVPAIRAGFGESRRVPARRLRALVGELQYADLVSGLRASIAAERG